ncbi:UDP-N-acetylmuramoyl-L-alanyl-D-glutamate--2,6-diaminopimelate ligase [Halothermothrix orenii]|uniref:UDP-N-acetylmuramoyl-L-alanyl-D-glutamate--2,6-diaminopimelate ligase n=1 Tax=Halothermothrix orenii (strain H 168 / OCM 544 / DSM 9562) TaxID=373903 RepID=B8CWJ1_HALOH|nr:UDP-N-acetylmuramoyl-L-alanyl-D-glutamate--2,6-diaminopimelate ligase [Halothermothrix orenii]ACL69660.1 UDP-N-acetylmuramyl-tripeptide synthetase [Halothermothrix orenii H 168]
MKISELIKDITPVETRGDLDKEIDNIVYDSRQVTDNSLFICIEGFNTDGHKYIDKAIKKGAVAVVIEKDLEVYSEDITYIRVNDSRETMGYLASTFYNYPLKNLSLIGVTGTNGKTTTTYLIKAILEEAGFNTGLVGTIKNIIGDETLPATRTTPESLDLYRLFARMVDSGVTHAVMEVSSHALDLKRVEGMEFKIGVFTNISQDHLDYHKSLDEYLKAKSRLFRQLEPGGWAVVNIDDSHSDKIIKSTTGNIITYGIEGDCDLKANEINLSPTGVSYHVSGKESFKIDLNLTGLFNVYNSLAAISCGHVLGINGETIKAGIEKVQGVAGRFELVNEGQDFAVVVDYAHTPDGMENVLETAREFVKGNIIVVFGCGGDRDKGKRPLMGKIATQLGDYCIITSDNPRSEDPMEIIKDIEKGIQEEVISDTPYVKEPDRRKAIFSAINSARKDDMVIIFGKGHETYQIFKDKTIPFDDREVAREALKNRKKGEDHDTNESG